MCTDAEPVIYFLLSLISGYDIFSFYLFGRWNFEHEDVFTIFTCSLSLSFKAKVKVEFVKCDHIYKFYIISKFIEVYEESHTSDKGSFLR